MKIVKSIFLQKSGDFSRSNEWKRIRREIRAGIRSVVWPPGASQFTIFRAKRGNGVKPIKLSMMSFLKSSGWELEQHIALATAKRPGKIDAVKQTRFGPYVVEWETGNISSSHRAMNKLALGLLRKELAGGTLVLPSRKLYQYLTDRIGNYTELEPYFELWQSIRVRRGLLQIMVVEHDATSLSVPKIPKGTDGRALR